MRSKVLPLLLFCSGFLIQCVPQMIERNNANDPCKGCSSDSNDPTGSGGGINLITWTQMTGSAQWHARSRFCSVTYDGKIWVIGGISGSPMAETWYSFDGTTWTKSSSLAPNSYGRFGHSCVVFANKIWLIGGLNWNGAGWYNDVWSTSDGVTWTRATANAGWPIRGYHSSVVFNNRIWVMGGEYTGDTFYNDVWSSLDGITWTQATANAAWSARLQLAATADLSKIYIMGGQTCSDGSCNSNSFYKSDVWSSSDGVTWSPVTITPPWGGRSGHAITYMNGAMYISGGTKYDYTSSGSYSDMWSSSDGLNWTQQNSNAVWATGPYPNRYNHQMVNMGNQIYILGGVISGSEVNDVWRSN